MKRGYSQHRTFFGKPLKLYAALIIIFALLSILYFVWRKPPRGLTGKGSRERNFNYLFNDFKNSHFPPNVQPMAFHGEKIVHLDLKGAPPKISYYSKLFPLLSNLGATGLLIEYEDMFPYTGTVLGNVSALNAYTISDIATINRLAKQSKLKVIPLIQTFGHLEFILKLAEFKEYREVAAYPQVICPTHESTLNILSDMIDQIVRSHPDIKMIHIGADEVYYLGVCERCTSAMSKFNLSKNLLFLEHVNAIVNMIKEKYPHLRVLMWDDEFRSINQNELRKAHLNSNLEPVVWKYTKDVYEELGPSLWNVYAQSFPKLWVASAFKGATGSNQFVSDVTHYLQNHRSWLSIISEYRNRIHFQGIIITGWQRYDHFAILCELLPVSIPALAMSLRLLLGYNDSPLSPPTEVARLLQCEQPYALIGPVFGSPRCSFPGAGILESVHHLQQLKQEYEIILDDSRVKGWMSDYNVAHSFSSPQYVESVTSPLSRIRAELNVVVSELRAAMQEVYDDYTIDEWHETYIIPFERQIETLWNAKEVLLLKDSWPRRPLKLEDDANEF